MLKLGLLGPFYAELDGTVVEGFVSAKAQSLLCYLAMNQTAHSRQLLAGLFWGDSPEKKALGTLRVTLSNLRKLMPGYPDSTRVSVSFRHDRPYWLDVEAVGGVIGALETSDIADLEGAVSLARGEFLEDFYIDGSPDFEMWLLNQCTYWKQATLQILARLATCYRDGQQYEQAAITLRRSLHLEPWDEGTHRGLMEALARAGDFNGALAQYEACCQALEAELGMEPMPETTALYRRIQAARLLETYALPQDDAPFIGREEVLTVSKSPWPIPIAGC